MKTYEVLSSRGESGEGLRNISETKVNAAVGHARDHLLEHADGGGSSTFSRFATNNLFIYTCSATTISATTTRANTITS